jgi:hypothetical protein
MTSSATTRRQFLVARLAQRFADHLGDIGVQARKQAKK